MICTFPIEHGHQRLARKPSVIPKKKKETLFILPRGNLLVTAANRDSKTVGSIVKNTKSLSAANNIYSFLHTQYALSDTVPVDNGMPRQCIYTYKHIPACLHIYMYIYTHTQVLKTIFKQICPKQLCVCSGLKRVFTGQLFSL